jgi:hypothetical protein
MTDTTRTKIGELIREFEAIKSKERQYIPGVTKIQCSGPDVVPAVILKKKMANSKWVGTCYLPIPKPFKGFKFAYEGKSKLPPDFKTLANYFVEKPSSWLPKKFADFIFVTNELERNLDDKSN